MAGIPPRFDDDDDDASSRYLRRMQGGDDAAPASGSGRAGLTSPPPAARLHPPSPAGYFHDDEPVRPFPGKPPVDWSKSLPPGAPSSITAADVVAPGSSNLRQIPALPTWFFSDGLTKLREGDYAEATRYYETLTQQSPDDPEGWFGLGAAWQGRGNVAQAVSCYTRGLEADKHLFPLAALAIEARPGQPAQLHALALALGKQNKRRALKCAITIFEEVMASPVTPRSLYMKADSARRKAKNDLEWLEALDNPAMMSMKVAALREHVIRNVLRTTFLILFLAGLSYVGYVLVRHSRAEATYQQGMTAFFDGYRVATYGSSTRQTATGQDAFELYQAALKLFLSSTQYRAGSLEANFMVIKSGQQVLRHMTTHYGAEKVPPDQVRNVREQIQKAAARCKALDPTGVDVRRQQALLDSRLVTVR